MTSSKQTTERNSDVIRASIEQGKRFKRAGASRGILLAVIRFVAFLSRG